MPELHILFKAKISALFGEAAQSISCDSNTSPRLEKSQREKESIANVYMSYEESKIYPFAIMKPRRLCCVGAL